MAAAITLAAVSEGAVGNVNVGEPEALSEAAWARAIAAVAGWVGEIVLDPGTAPTLQANWNIDLTADTSQIRDVLGFDEPFGPRVGLHRTVASIASRVRS